MRVAPPDAGLSRVILVAALTGVAAGAGGIALTLLLHGVQHLAFGYTEATFLTGVERASKARRVIAPAIGGLVVGVGWWALRRWSAPVPSVEKAMDGTGRLPVLPTTAEGALQILAVGFGASLGREGAPRLVGAALASWLSSRFGLTGEHRRTILACGAGAGLAAVYDVPLGGALFTLEILLASMALRAVVPALVSSAVATAIAVPVLSDQPTYAVAPVGTHPALIAVALVIGPLAGLAGPLFVALTARARMFAPSGRLLIVVVPVVFAALGAAAIWYPQLLGNGKGPAQLAFDGTLGATTLAALVVLKPVATAACLASGARGGLLTPSLATGALLGTLVGVGWSAIWPGIPIAAFAIVGAAAMLAVTMRAPLCAVVLILEFTHTGLTALAPVGIAVAAAIWVSSLVRPS